ncbi:MAG: type II toxin-antitoxin system RelE/ParE family toxin [Clostridiales bacterium]|jgi:plasmid stabilization system protein ParE|nr:type II toxin-antitoxin system RelE/ParE family toxin [Clostridiales bacterium]
MKNNIIISPDAYKDISRHVKFLSMISASAANKLNNEFYTYIKSLEENPLRNPIFLVENVDIKYRKLFVPKRYIILYEVEDDNVYVDYVIDCRQSNSWLLDF